MVSEKSCIRYEIALGNPYLSIVNLFNYFAIQHDYHSHYNEF